MSYLSDYANNVSNILMRQGEQKAAAIAQRGQAQQQLIGGIGNAIAGIPGNMVALKDAEAKRAAMAQEGKLRSGEIDAQKRAADAAQRALQDTQALDAAAAASTGPDGAFDYTKLAALVPGHLKAGVLKSAADYEKSMAEAAKTKAEIADLTDKHQLNLTNAIGSLALGVKAHEKEGPDAMRGAFIMGLSKAMHDGLIAKPEAQQLITNLDPSKLPSMLDQLIAKSPVALENQQKQAQSAESVARIPGLQAQGAMNAQIAAGMQGGLTPDQMAHLGIERANAVESARHNKAQEGVEYKKLDQQQNDTTQLTPAGLDAAASMFAKTGQLPALGMGDKTTRKQIINRAAALMPGLDIAASKADYTANASSLQNVTRTLDTLTAFENTAGKNLDQFLALAAKIPDKGSPWINAPLRTLNKQVVGDANQAAFEAARDVALREIARVTNDPKLSGVLSDSARQEVSGLSPKDATFAQIKAVAQTLKQDMANVHSSLSDQQSAIQSRIKGSGGKTPTAEELIAKYGGKGGK